MTTAVTCAAAGYLGQETQYETSKVWLPRRAGDVAVRCIVDDHTGCKVAIGRAVKQHHRAPAITDPAASRGNGHANACRSVLCPGRFRYGFYGNAGAPDIHVFPDAWADGFAAAERNGHANAGRAIVCSGRFRYRVHGNADACAYSHTAIHRDAWAADDGSGTLDDRS